VADFAGRSQELSHGLRRVAKAYFDACAALLTQARAAGGGGGRWDSHLSTLAADSFECEQIWCQLEQGQNTHMDGWVREGVASVEGLDAGDIFPGLLASDDEDNDDGEEGQDEEDGRDGYNERHLDANYDDSDGDSDWGGNDRATDDEDQGLKVGGRAREGEGDGEGPARFIQTDRWSGARAGYVFTTHRGETGYYLDNRKMAMKALKAAEQRGKAGTKGTRRVRIVAGDAVDVETRGLSGASPSRSPNFTPKGLKGLVEDRFLSLDDMEAFLKQAEAESAASEEALREESNLSKAKKGGGKGESAIAAMDVDDEEMAMDLLYGGMEEADETESDEESEDSDADYYGVPTPKGGRSAGDAAARKAKYQDFFDPPADGSEPGRDLGYESDESEEDVAAGLPDDQRGANPGPLVKNGKASFKDSPLDDDEVREPGERGDEEALSKHQRNLQRIQRQIDELEREALEDKHWSLKGEVKGSERPKDSALEIEMDFDHNVRPAPVITEETTQSLEELILRRIADGEFDDPKRAPPPELSARKLLDESSGIPDQKSDRGLGDVMEDEFRNAIGKGFKDDPARDRAVLECRKIFKELVQKLDVLTNYHFTPSNIPEMTVAQQPGNVPALVVEEKLPEQVSKASMLAPEEVYKTGKNQGEATQEGELTHEDRRRRRRAVKRKVRFLNNLDGVKAAKAAREMDDKVKAANKVAKKLGRGAGLKSTQFFKALQENQEAGAAKRSKAERRKEASAKGTPNPASLRL